MVYMHTFQSCSYMQFLLLVYSDMFNAVSGLWQLMVYYCLDSSAQLESPGKFDSFSDSGNTLMSFIHHSLIQWLCFHYLVCLQHYDRRWETVLNEMDTIVTFHTFSLVGQTNNHASSTGKSISLVNNWDSQSAVKVQSLSCMNCKYYVLLIWLIIYCIELLSAFKK